MTFNPEKHKAYTAKWRAANPEKVKALSAAYYAANSEKVKTQSVARYVANSEKRKAQGAEWRRANPEKVRGRRAAYYLDNLEKTKVSVSAWRAANPSKVKANNVKESHRRRAREASADIRVVADRDMRRLLERWRHSCAYCGARRVGLTWDHVIPFARGGRHSIGNLLPACQPCNASKHTKFLIEWLPTRKKALL